MADGLLNKASIILTPTGYKAGTLYNVAPVVEPYEDFDFARASVASRVNSSGLVEMVGRTLGSELVQNGDFSELGNNVLSSTWSTGSGWSLITDGVSCDGSVSGGNVVNNVELTDYNGKQFLLTYTLSNVTDSSTLRYKFGGGSLVVINGTEGTHSVYITNDATVDNFQFVSSTGWAGDVTNISLKQVDPNDYWNLGTGWSISDGKAVGVPGSTSKLEQSISNLSGKTCKVTFTLSDYGGSGAVIVDFGSTTSANINTNGEHTVFGTYDINKFELLKGSGFSGKIDNVSVKEIIDTNNIPRINYDSNGENGHILLEPTSTNLFTYSEDFENQWTAQSGITITNNTTETTSPSGQYNAAKVISTNNTRGFYKLGLSITTDATRTIYLKGSVGGESVTLKDGSGFGSTETYSLTTDWVRYELKTTSDGNTYQGLFVDDISVGTIYAWGAQIEALSYATSYIPTLTGSTVTRATETATGAGSADLINSTEGVLYAEISALADDLTNRCIALSDGTTDDRVNILFGDSSNKIRAIVKSNGSTSFDEGYTVTSILDYHKVAIKYKANDFALWIDGVERFTDTSGSAPIGLNQLKFDVGGGTLPFYGKCKALAVFNEALSDSELTQLTT